MQAITTADIEPNKILVLNYVLKSSYDIAIELRSENFFFFNNLSCHAIARTCEVLGHLVPALGADALEGCSRLTGQDGVLQPVQHMLQHCL